MCTLQQLDCMLEGIRFPQEGRGVFRALLGKVQGERGFWQAVALFCAQPKTATLQVVQPTLQRLAQATDSSIYTMQMLHLLCCCPTLQQQYRAAGYSDCLFYDTMWDLSSKAVECLQVKGVWGTFVSWWYPGFFAMTRFALGRLQYEAMQYREDAPLCRGGHVLRPGDRVYNCHIPSGLPLTEQACLQSYAAAHRFFGYDRGQPIAIYCHSWLLYPDHAQFLPQNSNVVTFLQHFVPLGRRDTAEFGEAWRVFGAQASLPAAEWPQDTGLRRAYRQHVLQGLPCGDGKGVLLFDGEKIL